MLFPGAGVLQPSHIDQGRQVRQTQCLNRDEEHLPFQVQNGEFPSSTCPCTSHEGRVIKYGCFEKVRGCTCKNPDIWIENSARWGLKCVILTRHGQVLSRPDNAGELAVSDSRT